MSRENLFCRTSLILSCTKYFSHSEEFCVWSLSKYWEWQTLAAFFSCQAGYVFCFLFLLGSLVNAFWPTRIYCVIITQLSHRGYAPQRCFISFVRRSENKRYTEIMVTILTKQRSIKLYIRLTHAKAVFKVNKSNKPNKPKSE